MSPTSAAACDVYLRRSCHLTNRPHGRMNASAAAKFASCKMPKALSSLRSRRPTLLIQAFIARCALNSNVDVSRFAFKSHSLNLKNAGCPGLHCERQQQSCQHCMMFKFAKLPDFRAFNSCWYCCCHQYKESLPWDTLLLLHEPSAVINIPKCTQLVINASSRQRVQHSILMTFCASC